MARVEIWATLWLTSEHKRLIHNFLIDHCNIRPRHLIKHLHLSVYHARRPIDGLQPLEEAISLEIPVQQTRFMVMAPGGENPRPELDPGKQKFGIRVQKANPTMQQILRYRSRLLNLENPSMLGRRKPSTDFRSAFGAHHFQPHVTLVRAGSGAGRNLHPLGQSFRQHFETLIFDRFTIEIKHVL